MRILIVGAGIAGTTAAYWLSHAGHEALYGTTIESIDDVDDRAYATFSPGKQRDFDLVVEAAGLRFQAR
ncbi:MAG: hypothetical protein ACTHZ9_04760 [Leucobacter sp.]